MKESRLTKTRVKIARTLILIIMAGAEWQSDSNYIVGLNELPHQFSDLLLQSGFDNSIVFYREPVWLKWGSSYAMWGLYRQAWGTVLKYRLASDIVDEIPTIMMNVIDENGNLTIHDWKQTPFNQFFSDE